MSQSSVARTGVRGDARDTAGPRDTRGSFIPGVCIATVGLVYLLTLSVNHSEAEDSLHYLNWITYGSLSEQFHANHLLYGFLNYLWFHVWKVFGFAGTAELPTKLLNVLGGLAALVMLNRIAARIGISVGLRTLTLLGIAFSYGFWWYSVECETYILPLVFVFLSWERILILMQEADSLRHGALLGLFHAAAVLFHQQHILLLGLVLLGFWLIHRERRRIGLRWPAWRQIMAYGAVFLFLIALSYGLVVTLVMDLDGAQEIGKWVEGHARSGSWGYWTSSAPLRGAVGFSRALLGGHFLFAVEGIAEWLKARMPGVMFTEEIFMVRDMSRILLILLTAFGALTAVLLVAAFLQFVTRRRRAALRAGLRPGSAGRTLFLLLLAYAVIYGIFNLWWEPKNIEFWVSLVPVFWMLLAIMISTQPSPKRGLIVLGVIVGCLIPVNLFGSVMPQLRKGNDYYYVFNQWFLHNCRRGDLVVSGAGRISNAYVRLYTGADIFSSVHSQDSLEVHFRSVLDHYRPKRVFISSTVQSPPAEIVERMKLDVRQGRIFFDSIRNELEPVHRDEWQDIYLLHRSSHEGEE